MTNSLPWKITIFNWSTTYKCSFCADSTHDETPSSQGSEFRPIPGQVWVWSPQSPIDAKNCSARDAARPFGLGLSSRNVHHVVTMDNGGQWWKVVPDRNTTG